MHGASAGGGHLLCHQAALALDDVEFHCLALNQETETIADNVGLMNKHCGGKDISRCARRQETGECWQAKNIPSLPGSDSVVKKPKPFLGWKNLTVPAIVVCCEYSAEVGNTQKTTKQF